MKKIIAWATFYKGSMWSKIYWTKKDAKESIDFDTEKKKWRFCKVEIREVSK